MINNYECTKDQELAGAAAYDGRCFAFTCQTATLLCM